MGVTKGAQGQRAIFPMADRGLELDKGLFDHGFLFIGPAQNDLGPRIVGVHLDSFEGKPNRLIIIGRADAVPAET